ncbi:MAG TPA: RNA polymerase sigma factor [Ignavibacteria bacterium]|nr:RNA polymerase sigma factor [Ignavibacteria bacterium]HRE09712.1 RNA polymerase sigma factor [Ignavibacteria bacterium]HRF65560.1 RNA polymerase sigma factor [Ignavibacteria bacterium]HRJ02944.1 RNA polymerase sigma factor [Ignavibacteria bacterium]HRJ84181.1 RNA polymerase sigma factor [Ignavibacteria bacterium]
MKNTELSKDRLFLDEIYIHHKYFLNVARKMTMNEFDAENLLQDTFIRAYRFLDSFEPGSNAKAWTYRIMKNLFINFNRKKQAHPCYSLDTITHEPHTEEGESRLKYFEIVRIIESIKDDYRQVIVLFHLQEFSLIEISKKLNWPLGTVKSRLHRARKEFRKVFEETT